MPGTIYLIPNLLGDASAGTSIPPYNLEVIRNLKHFAVEGEKSARRFLKLCGVMPPFEGINLYLLVQRSKPDELEDILRQMEGSEGGILSEAGCPAIADPGTDLVRLAHKKGWVVKPLVGPSSIFMAIMAGGLNGQGFTFHGYLPVQSIERGRRLRNLEMQAAETGQSQIFIETPFRNEYMLDDLRRHLRPTTLVSVACDLTLATEEVKTMSVADWRKTTLNLKNRPAVFSLWVQTKKRKPDRPQMHDND